MSAISKACRIRSASPVKRTLDYKGRDMLDPALHLPSSAPGYGCHTRNSNPTRSDMSSIRRFRSRRLSESRPSTTTLAL